MAAIINIQWNNLNRVLNEFADYFIQQARQKMLDNNSFASGKLDYSMEKIIEIDDASYKVSIQLEDYWYYLENGRKPGKFPPVNKIKDWIEIKPVLIKPDKNGKLPTVNQLSFLIARSIGLKGTKPHPFFWSSVDEAKKEFDKLIDIAIDEDIAAYIQDVVLDKIYNNLFTYF